MGVVYGEGIWEGCMGGQGMGRMGRAGRLR